MKIGVESDQAYEQQLGSVTAVIASGIVATPAATGGMVPYWIPEDETFTVPLYKQALFSETIDGPGTLDVIGMLIEVD